MEGKLYLGQQILLRERVSLALRDFLTIHYVETVQINYGLGVELMARALSSMHEPSLRDGEGKVGVREREEARGEGYTCESPSVGASPLCSHSAPPLCSSTHLPLCYDFVPRCHFSAL